MFCFAVFNLSLSFPGIKNITVFSKFSLKMQEESLVFFYNQIPDKLMYVNSSLFKP